MAMAMASNNRSQGPQGANDCSPESLYETYGDTGAALEAYPPASESLTMSQSYNRMILSHLSSASSSDDIARQLDEWDHKWKGSDVSLSARKKKRQEFIVAYNRSLVLYASGKPRDAAAPLLELLRPLVSDKKSALHEEILESVSCTALLVLDCILSVSEARQDGLQQLDETITSDALVAWLDSLDFESLPRLKFLLSLYKSRLDVAARDASGKMIESKLRGVRKELKLAIEVLNHKLRPTITGSNSFSAETASIGSLSEKDTEDNNSTHAYVQQVSGNDLEDMLQGLNQSALNLKAHCEELKGNTKKSLVLCTEALSSDPSYESIHSNNLAVVYASCQKRHLAMHSSARAIRGTSVARVFRSDGTALPDPTLTVFHNAAIVALEGRNFVSAYECMANCVQSSKEYADRPRCWLRMAEACIGLYEENKRRQGETRSQTGFFAVEANGEVQGVLIDSNVTATPAFAPENLETIIGTSEDLDQVSRQPLGRAVTCLEHVIRLCQDTHPKDMDCLESARCSLAYLKLELRDYQGASDTSLSILLDDNADDLYWREQGGVRERLHKQRLACVRLYASEALSALGNPTMKLFSSQDDGSLLNQLSVDLAGGITPNIDVNDVSKLLQAQIAVQTNASSVAATLDDLVASQQLAMSALRTSEQNRRNSDTSVAARNALLFCMLREGNREGALEILSSAR